MPILPTRVHSARLYYYSVYIQYIHIYMYILCTTVLKKHNNNNNR